MRKTSIILLIICVFTNFGIGKGAESTRQRSLEAIYDSCIKQKREKAPDLRWIQAGGQIGDGTHVEAAIIGAREAICRERNIEDLKKYIIRCRETVTPANMNWLLLATMASILRNGPTKLVTSQADQYIAEIQKEAVKTLQFTFEEYDTLSEQINAADKDITKYIAGLDLYHPLIIIKKLYDSLRGFNSSGAISADPNITSVLLRPQKSYISIIDGNIGFVNADYDLTLQTSRVSVTAQPKYPVLFKFPKRVSSLKIDNTIYAVATDEDLVITSITENVNGSHSRYKIVNDKLERIPFKFPALPSTLNGLSQTAFQPYPPYPPYPPYQSYQPYQPYQPLQLLKTMPLSPSLVSASIYSRDYLLPADLTLNIFDETNGNALVTLYSTSGKVILEQVRFAKITGQDSYSISVLQGSARHMPFLARQTEILRNETDSRIKIFAMQDGNKIEVLYYPPDLTIEIRTMDYTRILCEYKMSLSYPITQNMWWSHPNLASSSHLPNLIPTIPLSNSIQKSQIIFPPIIFPPIPLTTTKDADIEEIKKLPLLPTGHYKYPIKGMLLVGMSVKNYFHDLCRDPVTSELPIRVVSEKILESGEVLDWSKRYMMYYAGKFREVTLSTYNTITTMKPDSDIIPRLESYIADGQIDDQLINATALAETNLQDMSQTADYVTFNQLKLKNEELLDTTKNVYREIANANEKKIKPCLDELMKNTAGLPRSQQVIYQHDSDSKKSIKETLELNLDKDLHFQHLRPSYQTDHVAGIKNNAAGDFIVRNACWIISVVQAYKFTPGLFEVLEKKVWVILTQLKKTQQTGPLQCTQAQALVLELYRVLYEMYRNEEKPAQNKNATIPLSSVDTLVKLLSWEGNKIALGISDDAHASAYAPLITSVLHQSAGDMPEANEQLTGWKRYLAKKLVQRQLTVSSVYTYENHPEIVFQSRAVSASDSCLLISIPFTGEAEPAMDTLLEQRFATSTIVLYAKQISGESLPINVQSRYFVGLPDILSIVVTRSKPVTKDETEKNCLYSKISLELDMAKCMLQSQPKILQDLILNLTSEADALVASELLHDLEEKQETLYDLSAVVIHNGMATRGHYYAVVPCRENGKLKPDSWLELNDESTTKTMSTAELLSISEGIKKATLEQTTNNIYGTKTDAVKKQEQGNFSNSGSTASILIYTRKNPAQ
jgi:hypothetical protein